MGSIATDIVILYDSLMDAKVLDSNIITFRTDYNYCKILRKMTEQHTLHITWLQGLSDIPQNCADMAKMVRYGKMYQIW